jgi:hypothetical protein
MSALCQSRPNAPQQTQLSSTGDLVQIQILSPVNRIARRDRRSRTIVQVICALAEHYSVRRAIGVGAMDCQTSPLVSRHPVLTGAGEETVYELIECLCPLKIHGVATLRYEINLSCRHDAGEHLR